MKINYDDALTREFFLYSDKIHVRVAENWFCMLVTDTQSNMIEKADNVLFFLVYKQCYQKNDKTKRIQKIIEGLEHIEYTPYDPVVESDRLYLILKFIELFKEISYADPL